ncbi:transmembrane protein [Streptomyces coelicoflavus ZG0656]|nr:transmembrane protein [Streptomyces coelicoflavus ZG0656]MZE45430.1 hypothetical protein [Streptomyces sp. SID5477]
MTWHARRLRRNRRWALPLMALVCFGTPVVRLASGSVTAGLRALALAAVAMGRVIRGDLRFDRRLSQTRGRLQG